jgi:penicillin-binding protein 2
VLIALAGVGALLVAGDAFEADTTGSGADAGVPTEVSDGSLAILSPDEATEASPGEQEGAASEAPDDAEPTSPSVGGEVAEAPSQALDDAEAPALASDPNATPAGPSQVEVVQQWANLWSAGDYAGMYQLLSSDSQAQISEADFIDRYRAIAERAGLLSVALQVAGEPNLQSEVPVSITFESEFVGTFTQDNYFQLVSDGGYWKVNWNPSLIFAGLGPDGCVALTTDPSERGMIFARNGEVLARDGIIAEIGVVPGDITDEAGLLSELSDLLDMSQEDIQAAYADADPSWFVPIKLMLEEDATPLLDRLGALDGVRVQTTVGRVYPYGAATAHITGYVSRVTAEDIQSNPALSEGMWLGRTGLEAGANDLLSGKPGATLAIVDCATRGIRDTIAERPSTPGKDIILTIDLDLQLAVDKILTDVEGKDERASAVLIDPRTGAVLALSSHPTYDPNDFVMGFDKDEDWERIINETLSPLLNRATEGAYPSGSVFKVVTASAAMADLGYTSDTVLECPAQYELNGNIYRDWVVEWGEAPQGTLTLHDAIVQSCNTVFYDIGAKLDMQDPNLLPEMARAYGLGAITDIPYLPEVAGTIPDPQWKMDVFGDGWSTGDAINMAIGQGYVLVTPLQMANVYATIANGGTLLQPFIVEFSQTPGGPAERIGERTEVRDVPLNDQQMSELQWALRDQTSNPNGRGSARIFGPSYPFAIAGKTGTAQNMANREQKPHSWFAAFGPFGEGMVPTIASIVMIEEIGEGGQYAAPATKKIYDYYMQSDLASADPEGPPPDTTNPPPEPTATTEPTDRRPASTPPSS